MVLNGEFLKNKVCISWTNLITDVFLLYRWFRGRMTMTTNGCRCGCGSGEMAILTFVVFRALYPTGRSSRRRSSRCGWGDVAAVSWIARRVNCRCFVGSLSGAPSMNIARPICHVSCRCSRSQFSTYWPFGFLCFNIWSFLVENDIVVLDELRFLILIFLDFCMKYLKWHKILQII